jgi:hypothetical protein
MRPMLLATKRVSLGSVPAPETKRPVKTGLYVSDLNFSLRLSRKRQYLATTGGGGAYISNL